MALDFNIEPFFDDYSEDKKYYRILFRPGYAVQARELTQLQTVIQQQIKRHGDHIFKNGAMVIPGQIAYDTNTPTVAVADTIENGDSSPASIFAEITGKIFVGKTSGTEALVLTAAPRDGSLPPLLFVKYIKSGGINGTTTKFVAGEILEPLDGTVGQSLRVRSDGAEFGTGTTASIERGIYYIKNHFVLCDAGTVVVDRSKNNPDAKIGLKVTEQFVYPEEDESLLDNALGSPNYAAPGAARYYIDLLLTSLPLDTEIDPFEFIPLLTLVDGKVQFLVDKTEYSQLEKTFARRTFDESGDYTVKPFQIEIKEFRNNYRGVWVNNTAYLRGDVILVNDTTFYTCKEDHNSNTSGVFSDDSTKWIEDSNPAVNFGKYSPDNEPAPNLQNLRETDTSKLTIGIEPGKAYVKGYEIEKVSTQFIDIQKARDYSPIKESYSIDTSPGNWIIAENLYGIPDITTFKTVDLYQVYGVAGAAGTDKVGTARVWQIQYHDEAGPTTIGNYGDNDGKRYKVFLFDIKMNAGKDFKRDVKWLHSDTGSKDFTASIAHGLEEISGLVSSVSGSTITATDSTFIFDLKVGDYIYAGGSKVWKVTAIPSINQVTVDGSVTGVTAQSKIYRVYAGLNDPEKVAPIYSIPRYAVKSTDEVQYTFYKAYDNISVNSGTGQSDQIQEPSYTFGVATDSTNYILINKTTGAYMKYGTDYSVSGGATSTIKVTTTAGDVNTYYLIAALESRISSETPRSKTLTLQTENIVLSSGKGTLTKSDFYEIVSIKNGSTDVTADFVIDNGQSSSYYGIATIQTSNALLQSATVTVKYQYFVHGSTGDYFSVDSYTGINYDELSRLQTSTIDFRPVKNGNTDISWAPSAIPKYGEATTFKYDYYYGRVDKLSIDFSGKFIITKGIPGEDPKVPESPANAMDLYTLELEPYTFSARYGVIAKKAENKRYTMRDIGRLENRIKNLEYYSSLSNLEQNTANLKNYDNYGNERPQNGFIVDGFNGQGIGDAISADWQASIDSINNELRPKFNQQQITLYEKIDGTLNRSSKGYEVNGHIATLKIREKIPLVKQLRASKSEAVNPFDIYTWKGDIEIIPWSDTWFETRNRPDVILNDNNQYDAVVAKAEKDGVLGTVWNAWQIVNSGVTLSTKTESFSADRRSGDGGAWLDATFGKGPQAAGWAARQVTAQTTTIGDVQKRTGVRSWIESRTDYTVISDKIVATDLIPYMRERTVVFRGRALKPLTRVYSFFDDTNVDGYVTPSKRIVVTPYGSTTMPEFLLNSSVGSNVNSAARKINDVVAAAYSYGEVLIEKKKYKVDVTVNNVTTPAGTIIDSGVTCVCVGQETTNLTGTGLTNLLYIENIRGGTFNSDTTQFEYYLQGEFDATRKVTVNKSSTLNSSGIGSGTYSISELQTSYSGQIFGTFVIPNNNSLKFRTGTREFRITDNADNNRKNESTSADAFFESRGILETREKTILATKTARVVSEQVTPETRTVPTSTTRNVVSDTGWYDPLAQTFLVDVPGGCFVTDVDLYFQQKPTAGKDPDAPVRVEIRNVVNGYPGGAIVPYSRVTLPVSKVNVDSTKATAATNFKFESPIYLQNGVEYCLCIFSDSSKYRVWVSETGLADVGGAGLIATQPYAGVLFKSQNASTWTADQTQDLKFQLNRAKFTIGSASSQSAGLQLVNEHVNTDIPYNVAQFDVNSVVVTDTALTAAVVINDAASKSIPLGDSVMFDSEQTINDSAAEISAGYSSIVTNLTLSTEKENLSPVIDLSRCTATLVSNLIENSAAETGDYENISTGGDALAKYVTKVVKLNDPATTLRILFDNNTPSAARYDIYYKIGNAADSDFELNEFTRVTSTNQYVTKYKQSSKTENIKQFTESEFILENLPAFTAVRVKIVMKSSNTSKVPRIKDLRVIAYA